MFFLLKVNFFFFSLNPNNREYFMSFDSYLSFLFFSSLYLQPIFSSLYLQPIILLIVESDFIILLNFLINGCLNYHPCFLNYYGQFFDSWTGCYFLLFIFLFRIFIIFFFYSLLSI